MPSWPSPTFLALAPVYQDGLKRQEFHVSSWMLLYHPSRLATALTGIQRVHGLQPGKPKWKLNRAPFNEDSGLEKAPFEVRSSFSRAYGCLTPGVSLECQYEVMAQTSYHMVLGHNSTPSGPAPYPGNSVAQKPHILWLVSLDDVLKLQELQYRVVKPQDLILELLWMLRVK